MTTQRWMLAVWFSLASVIETGESVTTTETQKYTCRTFGSGVVQPFNGSSFYVRSSCRFTLTHFTHNRVECDITTRRGNSGLLVDVEIIINKIRTVLQNGSILVEKKSVSLPYDHTYQHIFHYGIYSKLRSSLLPLSVVWHNVPGGIDTLWVELEQELSTDMGGLCGKHNISGNEQQLITESEIGDDTCQTRDPVFTDNQACRLFFSYTLDCLQARIQHYIKLCDENIYNYEQSKYISCAFFKEFAQQCGNSSYVWNVWRSVTGCVIPSCPGDLVYVEQDAAFVPTCSNPNPRFSNQDLISSCVCPVGKVLNDAADGFHCVNMSSCPCVFAGESYSTGDTRSTICQSCMCDSGKWRCSENFCPAKCVIEGQFVTTFDGKQYAVPGKCTYVASQALNWTIAIKYFEKAPSLKTVTLQLFQETYTFSQNMVKVGQEEISELHQSDHALVFWQSSMYVQVYTSFGIKIQVQMSPEIQLYITPPSNHTGMISGLCGNSNNDTTDDFTTSSGIVENSAQPFAQSWSVDACAVNIPSTCINTDNEIFADEKCSVLNNPTGIFAKCHDHIPTDHYHTACIQRTCSCGSSLQQCLCVALGSYAKACASLGVIVGDWRKATNCTLQCQKNQGFSYNMQICNHTCRSLSGPDPRCGLDDAPVEGCGCPEGTHLNQGHICTPKAECVCHYYGGTTSPGSIVIDGRMCICENGELQCAKDCGCRNGKVCVHCAEYPVNTARKTCDSLSKPMGASMKCDSGCYCSPDQYEDHRGNCVTLDNCTCVYSGKVFSAGQSVKTSCKTCVCGQGQWHCKDMPCPGKCQVYGNGHYQTFDSKWYRFDGHCQYTLVEDDCGNGNGTFSVRVESVPCCDEALTCSRSIILDLQGSVTLTLSDMKVTRHHHEGWTPQVDPLYSTHTVGLYIIISVPSRGITLIWDKHTRITIELHAYWRNRVCGLCGNFDSNEMNDLQISGSAVVSSPLAFGNSWKAPTPPCSDVTTEMFPCERNSYCSAWAQRRCMILTGDTFNDCHLKVDPEPYYHACVQESCSCEFEGKFLGFCTAVAAYAEACSDQDVCVNWRTPDLCPVYCDYYNEQGQCSWHYEACGEMLTCGKSNYFTHKLEGCYPRCSREEPFYDENTGECTKLRNCTCYFNDTIIQPGAVVLIHSIECHCENGTIKCQHVFKTSDLYSTSTPTAPPPTTMPTTTTSTAPTTTASATTTETTVLVTTSMSTTTTALTTAETWPTALTTTSSPLTTITDVSPTTRNWSTVLSSSSTPSTMTTSATTETTVLSTTSTPTTATALTTAETRPTAPTTTSTPLTTITDISSTTGNWPTVVSSTSTPSTMTTSATTETTVLSTTSTPTTTVALTTAETWSTAPTATSTPLTTITGISSTTGNWPTVVSSTSTPSTTTTSATTETTVLVPTSMSTTTAALTTAETWPTAPTTTSTPLTTITGISSTTGNWPTVVSSTSTPSTTTTSATTETTMLSTTSTPTTTAALTTAETWSTAPTTTSTPLTTITDISSTSSTSTPSTTTTSATTETTVLSTTSTPTTTAGLTTAETWPTAPTTTSTPLTTITGISSTTGNWPTVVSSTSTPSTTTTSATTETTVLSTTSTPTTTMALTTAETWSTAPTTTSTPLTTVTGISSTTGNWPTVVSSTSTPSTMTTSATTETTVLSTTSTPTTATALTTAETWPTAPTTTSTPLTTITGISSTTGNWPTVVSSTSTQSTTTTSATTETTVLSTASTPTTTAGLTTAETWSATPSTTSTPQTAITNVSTTTGNWSTVLSTTSTPMTTTTLTTTETSVTPTKMTNTPASTTIMGTTPSMTTASSTTIQTTTTELPTSESPSSVLTTLYTTQRTVSTNASTTRTTESEPTETDTSTYTFTTQPTTKHTEQTATTLQSATTFPTNATTVTSGLTEVTTTETSTETFTSSTPSTTQPTKTSSETTVSHGVTSKSTMMPPTTYATEMSTSEGLTSATSTTEPITEETGTTMTTTGKTFTPVSEESTTHICECKDLKRKKRWSCGDAWTEDCFNKTCTEGKIELTPVVCPDSTIPICPRNQATRVSDGCCETWKCDCRCELYGDPHYISFQGVAFDFMDDCTYILVEERSPRHHLTIAVDNFYCVPGLKGSCAKGIILKYQDNIATLNIIPHLFAVQATLNNVTIVPPYEEQGWRFETTGYIVSIHLPEIRSYVSLSPSWTLVVSLAMEHFLNNTQGQCGVCGVGSCVRKGGQIEDDSCCEKTAYDWVYADPLKPSCVLAPTEVPCHPETTLGPTSTPTSTTSCPASPLCELLDHTVFSNCSRYVNLIAKKKNCKFDSCRNGACPSLEQAAEECKKAGLCIDWRRLTNGSCDVPCPEGLVYKECSNKLDDFCYGGVRYPGASLENNSTGCFCPSGQSRAGNHSNICVSDCPYCKGPLGEPRLPGEVWKSGCHLCTCNNQTRMEECFPKPPGPPPTCSPSAVLVNSSCCGDQICVNKTCSYHGKTYKVGDRWKDAAHPCKSFSCNKDGIQTETRVCPRENCQEEDRIWDDQHCCFTCNQSCAPKVTSINITRDNCTTVMQMPVCQGQCVSEPRVMLHGDLQVEQECRCCQERSSERRSVTLQCFDLTTRHYNYRHITGCECRSCGILR